MSRQLFILDVIILISFCEAYKLRCCFLYFPDTSLLRSKYLPQRSLFKLGLRRWLRFQVLTAANMKITAFWDIAPYSLVEVDRRCGRLLREYTAQYPRRLSSSMKMAVFWYVAPYSLVDIARRFRGAYCRRENIKS
jgi:hypothetical protein